MVINRSRRRQKNADWEAAGTVQEILRKPVLFNGDYPSLTNKPTIPTITGSVTRIPKITAPNTLGASSIEDYMNRLLVNGASDDGSSTVSVNGAIKTNHSLTCGGALYFDAGWSNSPLPNSAWLKKPMGGKLFLVNDDASKAFGFRDNNEVLCLGDLRQEGGSFESLGNIKANNLKSGTYVPSITYTHAPAPTIASTFYYHIVGDWVHVFGDLMITPQGGVSHVLTLSLPVPSAFTGDEASGTIMAGAMLGFGSVYALPSGVVGAQVNNQLSLNQRYVINFKYKIV